MKCPYVPIKLKNTIFQEKFQNKDNNASMYISEIEDNNETLINELMTKKKKFIQIFRYETNWKL